MRIGSGYDVHKLAEGRDCIIGGVKIPYEKGLLGHSDADVLLHAIADALLGAAALGDIGRHFPDNDPQYKGADSRKIIIPRFGVDFGRRILYNKYRCDNYCTKAQNGTAYRTNAEKILQKPFGLI